MKDKLIKQIFDLGVQFGAQLAEEERDHALALDRARKAAYRFGRIAEAERIGDRKRALDIQGGHDE